ncbi:hypothetical protein FB480_11331 [Agrobacterium vitis]|nr:hypothetical protein FB480_11331 [Agrobacterium vitis]
MMQQIKSGMTQSESPQILPMRKIAHVRDFQARHAHLKINSLFFDHA